jgi:hypothetical protein
MDIYRDQKRIIDPTLGSVAIVAAFDIRGNFPYYY